VLDSSRVQRSLAQVVWWFGSLINLSKTVGEEPLSNVVNILLINIIVSNSLRECLLFTTIYVSQIKSDVLFVAFVFGYARYVFTLVWRCQLQPPARVFLPSLALFYYLNTYPRLFGQFPFVNLTLFSLYNRTKAHFCKYSHSRFLSFHTINLHKPKSYI